MKKRILKYISIGLTFCMLFSTLVFSSFANSVSAGYYANDVFYSPMSEPIVTDNIKWFCVASGQGRENRLMMIAADPLHTLDVQVDVANTSNGKFKFTAIVHDIDYPGTSTNCPIHVIEFNILSGNVIWSRTYPGSSMVAGVLGFDSIVNAADYPEYWTGGVIVNDSANDTPTHRPMKINWNGSLEYSFYYSIWPAFESYLNGTLDNIDLNISSTYSELCDLSSFLRVLYRDFSNYFEDITDYLSVIDTELFRIDDQLNYILNKLFGEGETLWEDNPELETSVDDLIDAEEQLTQDLHGGIGGVIRDQDVDAALEGHSNVFSFFSDSLNRLCFSNSSIYSLIIYALILGIVVMLIGRRIYV